MPTADNQEAIEEKSAPVIPKLPPRMSGRNSWQVFLRSLKAFFLREIKHQFGRSRLGYVWAFAEPASAVAILTMIHTAVRGHGGDLYQTPAAFFFVFGVVPYFVFSNALSSTQNVCTSQKGLFNYRQIKPIDIMLANAIIDGLLSCSVLAAFLIGWKWMGLPLPHIDPLELSFALFSLFALGLGTGLMFEVFATVYKDLRSAFAIITRPLFFVSGAFFTMGMLPSPLDAILWFNPVLHGVDLARDAVLTGYTSPASWLYLWFFILMTHFIGLAAYRRYLYRLI